MVYLAIFICIFIVIAVIIYFLNTEIAVEYIRNGINDHVLISFSPVKGVKFKYEASLMGIRENGFKFDMIPDIVNKATEAIKKKLDNKKNAKNSKNGESESGNTPQKTVTIITDTSET